MGGIFMVAWYWIVIAAMAGAIIGTLVAALCAIAKSDKPNS